MAEDYMSQWNVNGTLYDIHDSGRGQAEGVATLNANSKVPDSQLGRGSPNGVASLDENGRVPYSQLPESATELKGYWNANTNTPTLADGIGTSGDFYFVDTAGTQNLGSGSQYFAVGDRVLYDGSIWKNIASGTVRTINGHAPNAQGDISSVVQSISGQAPDQNGNIDLEIGDSIPLSFSMYNEVFRKVAGTLFVPYHDFKSWVTTNSSSSSSYMLRIKEVNNFVYSYSQSSDNSDTSVRLQRSADGGKTWTSLNISVSLVDIVYIHGIYFAVNYGHTYTSTNGITFTEALDETSNALTQVYTYNSSKNFTDTTYAPSGQEVNIIYDEDLDLFVAIGGEHFYWSTNGLTWNKGSGYAYSVASTNKVFKAKGIFVAPGSDNYLISTDGKNWTSYYLPTTGTYFPQIVGMEHVKLTGISSAKADKFWAITYGFVGSLDSGVPILYYSDDAITWTPELTFSSSEHAYSFIKRGETLYFSVLMSGNTTIRLYNLGISNNNVTTAYTEVTHSTSINSLYYKFTSMGLIVGFPSPNTLLVFMGGTKIKEYTSLNGCSRAILYDGEHVITKNSVMSDGETTHTFTALNRPINLNPGNDLAVLGYAKGVWYAVVGENLCRSCASDLKEWFN